MRKPFLVAIFLAVALAAVIFAKWKLDTAIREGKFVDTAVPEENMADTDQAQTIDIGVQQDPATEEAAQTPHAGQGTATKTDVMAALVEARQSFKNKPAVTDEAKRDPHSTPPTIIQAAETLGRILTLERQNPAYKPEFQAFYLECSKDGENLTVTRVQCLENYVKSRELNPADEEALLGQMDATVRQIYRELKK